MLEVERKKKENLKHTEASISHFCYKEGGD